MKRRSIKNLEAEIRRLKKKQHNTNMDSIARDFQKSLIERMTPDELKFKHIAELKKLHLECQYKIDIKYKGIIKRFYIVDFCDTVNKIIFEVDGGYHNTKEQRIKDYYRTKDLESLGYKVYRITNEEVYQGLTTALLDKAYRNTKEVG
jgi:very-short-patch-repair endonuclease